MSATDHATVLLQNADDDFKALVGMGQLPAQFTDAIFGFHAQQAAEKAIKAWLTRKGVKYTYTHDLNALLNLLAGAGEDVTESRTLVKWNDFAVHHRYGSIGLDDDDPIDRPATIDEIRKLLELVRSHVESTPA